MEKAWTARSLCGVCAESKQSVQTPLGHVGECKLLVVEVKDGVGKLTSTKQTHFMCNISHQFPIIIHRTSTLGPQLLHPVLK